MNDKILERAIELGKRVEHVFSSLIGADNFPYAPEWAEHARSDRSDDACDDGRAGEA